MRKKGNKTYYFTINKLKIMLLKLQEDVFLEDGWAQKTNYIHQNNFLEFAN